jgi:hypothetical protein
VVSDGGSAGTAGDGYRGRDGMLMPIGHEDSTLCWCGPTRRLLAGVTFIEHRLDAAHPQAERITPDGHVDDVGCPCGPEVDPVAGLMHQLVAADDAEQRAAKAEAQVARVRAMRDVATDGKVTVAALDWALDGDLAGKPSPTTRVDPPGDVSRTPGGSLSPTGRVVEQYGPRAANSQVEPHKGGDPEATQ